MNEAQRAQSQEAVRAHYERETQRVISAKQQIDMVIKKLPSFMAEDPEVTWAMSGNDDLQYATPRAVDCFIALFGRSDNRALLPSFISLAEAGQVLESLRTLVDVQCPDRENLDRESRQWRETYLEKIDSIEGRYTSPHVEWPE